jgi:hypothetical protein
MRAGGGGGGDGLKRFSGARHCESLSFSMHMKKKALLLRSRSSYFYLFFKHLARPFHNRQKKKRIAAFSTVLAWNLNLAASSTIAAMHAPVSARWMERLELASFSSKVDYLAAWIHPDTCWAYSPYMDMGMMVIIIKRDCITQVFLQNKGVISIMTETKTNLSSHTNKDEWVRKYFCCPPEVVDRPRPVHGARSAAQDQGCCSQTC